MLLFRSVTLYLCLISPLVGVLAQRAISSPVLTPEVDAFINDLLSDWNSPGGVSVAVVHKAGNYTWDVETKGYGVAKADGTNVTAQTLFAIGSNSKLFDILATGLLIANTSLNPRISWNTKIKTIIPEWELMDPVATGGATIIDLMSHRSGLPRHDFMASLSDDVLSAISKFRFLRASTEFRETLQYNNNMYTLLSYIPTAILPSKPKFARYVKAKIFEPLGLNSTTYSFDVANATGNLADGFSKQQTNSSASPFDVGIPRTIPFWAKVGGEDGHYASGSGGVISNAVDMASWLQTLLSGGKNTATKEVIIPPEAIDMVLLYLRAHRNSRSRRRWSMEVGRFKALIGDMLLWSMMEAFQVSLTNTSSAFSVLVVSLSLGFNSYISRYPFDGVGIAVLTNDNELGNAISIAIKYRLSDQALGLSPIDSKAIVGGELLAGFAASPPPVQRPDNATLPPNGVESLVGVYNNPAYGQLELCLASTNSMVTVTNGCQALLSNVTDALPGVVNQTIPTLLAKWDRPFGSYLRMSHFNGSVFPIAMLDIYPTGNSSNPFWVSTIPAVISSPVAEFAQDNGTFGFGLTGVWGAGDGVPEPLGNTVRERSEVWFTKT